jgi:hypothetical protein
MKKHNRDMLAVAVCSAIAAVAIVGLTLNVNEIRSSSPPPVVNVDDFSISLQLVSGQCTSAAGCEVIVRPQISYSGKGPAELCDVTYSVLGDKNGEIVQTARHRPDADRFIIPTVLFLDSIKVEPKATVTEVSC